VNPLATAEPPPQGLPDNCQDWHRLGLTCLQRKDALAASQAFLRALAHEPEHADSHHQLGRALLALGQADAAERAHAQALRHDPTHLDAATELAERWAERGHFAAAELGYRMALALAPGRAILHVGLALALHKLGRHEQAVSAYERALALDGSLLQARNNLGAVLYSLGRHQQAQAVLHELLDLEPDSASAWTNLGNSYQAQGQAERAESAFRRAMALDPKDATATYNLAGLMTQLGRPADAELLLRQALAIRPSPLVEFSLAILLLTQGRYEEGWQRHESRSSREWPADAVRITRAPELDYPPWRGEPLQGRRVLVVHEQGAGDQIQFVRYLPLLLARGPLHVTLICPTALQPLFEQFQGPRLTVRSVSTLDELPPHDFWVLLMSLPLHLGTRSLQDIPARLPYLRADAQRQQHWRARLPQAVQRVGLVWKGSAGHRNDAQRSLPHLSSLAPLWRAQGLAFVSLQKGQGEDEAAAAPADMPLTHLGSQIQDFADSAAIVSQLDLVICVDTGLAHLAGALGIACWVLLPQARTDWRWLKERQDSPWYPGALRLFRQQPDETWDAVIERVAAQLCLWRPSGGGPQTSSSE
jgi:tetratricopeptide (TPR) repeat protein